MRKQGALPTLREGCMKFSFVDHTFQTEWPRVRDEFRSICYVWVPRHGWHEVHLGAYSEVNDTCNILIAYSVDSRPRERNVSIVAKRFIKEGVFYSEVSDIESTFSNEAGFHLEVMQALAEIKSKNYAHFVYLLGGMFGSVIALYFVFAHILNT